MKYFFDTEFIEDGRTIDLVSIGIVCEDGREYYAVSAEADLTKASPWVRANVLTHLPPYSSKLWKLRSTICRELVGSCVVCDGVFIRRNEPVEFWAYFADYDWVALCQLFGRMSDLPDGFPMYCRDLKQAMDRVGVKHDQLPPGTDEHHALADARWVRDAYRWMAKEILL